MKSTLSLNDFYYDLPENLIARYPCEQRDQSRMLVLDHSDGNIEHRYFKDLIEYLRPKDLLVLNNTRVMLARLHARKSSGGAVEITVERFIGKQCVLAHIKANRPLKIGAEITILCKNYTPSKHTLGVVKRANGEDSNSGLYELELLDARPWSEILAEYGELPLPPYLKRAEEAVDRNRYHTVFAKYSGAIAAPTAGLHFSHTLLEQLKQGGVNIAYITLHVGYGTFATIRTTNIVDHKIHAEYMQVDNSCCQQVRDCNAQGGRVIAVGTTVVRALETAATKSPSHALTPYNGESRLFIYPSYQFKIVQGLVTNFHHPNTSLLPLVAAFAGTSSVMRAYNEAVARRYRFLSYGDAMLILH